MTRYRFQILLLALFTLILATPMLSTGTVLGRSIVAIGEDLSWPELVEASTSAKRSIALPLTVERIDEWVRFPASSTPLIKQDGEFVVDPTIQEAAEKAKI